MRPRLVFIDDDPQELDDFGPLVREAYDYVGVRWPMAGSLEEAIGPAPALFVLDMYFHRRRAGRGRRLGKRRARGRQRRRARWRNGWPILRRGGRRETTAARNLRLHPGRVRPAVGAVPGTRTIAGNRPRAAGRAAQPSTLPARAGGVYSRKVTTREAVLALAAGATAVIPKAPSPPRKEDGEWVLRELEAARAVPAGRVRRALARGLGIANFNVTVFPAPAGSNPLPPRRHADHP